MLARAALAVTALAMVAVLAGRLAAHEACEDARRLVFLAGVGTDAAFAERAARDVVADCPGSDALVAAAGPVRASGATRAARRVLEEAVRRAPRDARSWTALARLTADSDPARSRAAAARARALDPLGRAPGP